VANTTDLPRPISDALNAELARLRDAVPAGKAGQVSVGVSTQGASIGGAWKPSSGLTLTGYAGRMWGGGWTAAATGTVTW
jgi:hypothetical protein